MSTKLYQQIDIVLYLSISLGIILTRIISLIFFELSTYYQNINQQVINDPFHHYHLGAVMFFISLLVRKSKWGAILKGFSIGIILEESVVLLDDLGLHGFKLYYLSRLDFIWLIFILGLVIALVLIRKSKKQ